MHTGTRGSAGLLLGAVASLAAAGCLLEDPNMDGILSMTSYTGSGDDTGDGTADGGSSGTTPPLPTGDPLPGLTIYDLQMGAVAPQTLVTLEGVMVSTPIHINQDEQGVSGDAFIQDPAGGPFSGIRVYLFGEVVMGVPLNPGDTITITGEYQEFFDESQLQVTSAGDVQVTGTGTLPPPIDVTPLEVVAGSSTAEQYEGVPVCLSDVTTIDSTNQFGDFHVDDNMAVTNLFLFDSDDFLDVLTGTAFSRLCGPIVYSFSEYKVAPRDADDFDADLVTCDSAATMTTIYDIQNEMFQPGELVMVQDVVVSTPWTADGDVFWVQDPGGGERSGIAVYLPAPDGYSPTPGDELTLCGSYDEFFDQSQLAIQSSSDVSMSGRVAAPTPMTVMPSEVGVAPAGEDWEGVLVVVDASSVTEAANRFGEWIVDDVLMLTPEFFPEGAWPLPMIDDTFTSLTGVMTYSFGRYKLAPRDAADIVE